MEARAAAITLLAAVEEEGAVPVGQAVAAAMVQMRLMLQAHQEPAAAVQIMEALTPRVAPGWAAMAAMTDFLARVAASMDGRAATAPRAAAEAAPMAMLDQLPATPAAMAAQMSSWDATHGLGGGGGGGGADSNNTTNAAPGGNGGSYGGGGGGSGDAAAGGNGAQGIIVVTYHP